MSKARTNFCTAVVYKQNRGGGAATSANQGGGNSLIGLISTKNKAINGAMVRNIRTRSDGGKTRNWVFCMNQLGGVGRRWGQAAGPGNRGAPGVKCAEEAALSRGNHHHPRQHACSVQSIAAMLEWLYNNNIGTLITPPPKNAPKWIVVSSSQTGQVHLALGVYYNVSGYSNDTNTLMIFVDPDDYVYPTVYVLKGKDISKGDIDGGFISAGLMNNDWSQFARSLLSDTGLQMREVDQKGFLIRGGKTTHLKIIACGF